MLRQSITALTVSALMVAGAAAVGTPSLARVVSGPTGSTLTWQACGPVPDGDPSLTGFQCSSLHVPLNYNRPSGRTITLGMVKHPARSGHARGTIFFNPGGPSDSGSVYLPALLDGFGARILRHFDLVSWDPRGMGGLSSPVVMCFPSLEREEALIGPALFPPLTPAQQRDWGKRHSKMNRKCGDSDLALLRHVSTADNARDLDSMRRAMGLRRISYYGTSYGTFLGATYANMFPSNYRHMVIDGAIDPVAWTQPKGRLSTFMRAGSNVASAKTLRSFLRICGTKSTDRCAFSAGNSNRTVNKYNRLLAAAQDGIRTPEGPISANDVVGLTIGNLYLLNPARDYAKFIGWSALADDLQQLWQLTRSPATSRGASVPSVAVEGAQRTPYMGAERQPAVICGESPNPATRKPYLRQATDSLERVGVGGSVWTWIAYCADWPVQAASPYLGPWDRVGNPIVVVGTTGDPATPYSNSVAASRLLPGARLLTVKGYGHTQLANPSACAQRRLAAYFFDGALPRGNAPDCRQNAKPFSE